MKLIDVHTHLDHEQFATDRDAIIENAKIAGLAVIINNGSNKESNRASLDLAKKYPIIKPALGLFPIDAQKMYPDEVDAELEFIEQNKQNIVAIGEVGLDFYWEKSERLHAIQKKYFLKLIQLSQKIRKPLIVHSRNAEETVIEMLEAEKAQKVVLHSFEGNLKLAKRAEHNGWFISIPTNIIRSTHFQNLVKEININNLLTETDAPYLGPVSGSRNEPANIAKTIPVIAQIKKMTTEEVENNIFFNYQRLF